MVDVDEIVLGGCAGWKKFGVEIRWEEWCGCQAEPGRAGREREGNRGLGERGW